MSDTTVLVTRNLAGSDRSEHAHRKLRNLHIIWLTHKYIQRCAQDTRRYFECLLILCLLQMFSTFSNLDLLNHQWAVFYQWLSSQVFWRAMNHLLFPQKTELIELYLAAEIIHVLDTEGLFLHIHPTASANSWKIQSILSRNLREAPVKRLWFEFDWFMLRSISTAGPTTHTLASSWLYFGCIPIEQEGCWVQM